METNLPLSFVNIILFILFVVILGQPEQVVLILMSMIFCGTIVANNYYDEDKHAYYGNFILQDLFIHTIPALIAITMSDFSKIGPRQYIFALLYPILYLTVTSYKDDNGWTNFKIQNPIQHVEHMYPNVNKMVFFLYYITLYIIWAT